MKQIVVVLSFSFNDAVPLSILTIITKELSTKASCYIELLFYGRNQRLIVECRMITVMHSPQQSCKKEPDHAKLTIYAELLFYEFVKYQPMH